MTLGNNTVAVADSNIAALGERVATPTYDRTKLRAGIAHIGVGGFHRAHLATYADDLAKQGVTDWGICGIGLLPSDSRMASALSAQGGLYTLVSRGADETEVSVIGSIIDYLHVAADPEPFHSLVAAPTTQIVSMTVTEGGYPVDDATGEFVESEGGEGTTFGTLADALEARRTADGGPLTILSCDNVVGNGHVARTATLGAARRHSEQLVQWIESNVSFPNSMVDRITPATSPSDIDWLRAEHGIDDQWPVVAEPFRQWVVEDDFRGERLPLELLDVIVTNDVTPYELAKLRLLNAGHSCLAYLAALVGVDRVDVAMANPGLRRFLECLLHEEAKPTLPPAEGIDLDSYIAVLIERFSNPNVGDQIARLCQDGTSKFPKFLFPTIEAGLAVDGDITRATTALAGWCEYLATTDDPAPDPLLEVAQQHARLSLDDPRAFLDFDAVFSSSLADDPRFVDAFVAALTDLRGSGVLSTLTAIS